MADKNIVFNMHTFTNKCMAGYLAAFTDRCTFLYLYKSAYPAIVTNAAAVSIYEIEYFDIFTNLYIVQALFVIIDRYYLHDGWLYLMQTSLPLFLMDTCEASSILTTCLPRHALARGSFLLMIH